MGDDVIGDIINSNTGLSGLWNDATTWLSNSGINWGGVGAAGLGALTSLFGGSSGGGGSSAPTGYQGGIPRYTASREVLPVSDEGRRPGSGGRYYFGDMVYTPMESTEPQTAPATAPAPTEPTPNPQDDLYYNGNISDNAVGGLIRLAQGGIARLAPGGRPPSAGISTLGSYSDGRQVVKGPGTGQSDDIPATIEGQQPALLARDEFVIPADVVSMLGDGSSDAGAEELYAMMDRIREAAHGKKQQQKQINPMQVLPA